MLEKNKKHKVFLYHIIVMIFLVLQAIPAEAKSDFETNVTPEERAIISFFRAANEAPDYNFWIKSSPEYKGLSSIGQEEYLLKETLRLGHGYSYHDQENDVLELSINALVKYIPAEEGATARIIFKFFDTDSSYIPSFNYPYGTEVVSLVINQLAGFSSLPLQDGQAKAMLAKIPYDNDFFDAKLKVHVRVTSGNTKKAIEQGKTRQWLMIGEIAYITCNLDTSYSQQKNVLWEYIAPWYAEAFRVKNMPEEEKYPHPYDLYKD